MLLLNQTRIQNEKLPQRPQGSISRAFPCHYRSSPLRRTSDGLYGVLLEALIMHTVAEVYELVQTGQWTSDQFASWAAWRWSDGYDDGYSEGHNVGYSEGRYE